MGHLARKEFRFRLAIAKLSLENFTSKEIEKLLAILLSSLLEPLVYLGPGDPPITCDIEGRLVTGISFIVLHFLVSILSHLSKVCEYFINHHV